MTESVRKFFGTLQWESKRILQKLKILRFGWVLSQFHGYSFRCWFWWNVFIYYYYKCSLIIFVHDMYRVITLAECKSNLRWICFNLKTMMLISSLWPLAKIDCYYLVLHRLSAHSVFSKTNWYSFRLAARYVFNAKSIF